MFTPLLDVKMSLVNYHSSVSIHVNRFAYFKFKLMFRMHRGQCLIWAGTRRNMFRHLLCYYEEWTAWREKEEGGGGGGTGDRNGGIDNKGKVMYFFPIHTAKQHSLT